MAYLMAFFVVFFSIASVSFYEAGPVKRLIKDGWDHPSIRVLHVSPWALKRAPIHLFGDDSFSCPGSIRSARRLAN
jgi:hypothetical protein